MMTPTDAVNKFNAAPDENSRPGLGAGPLPRPFMTAFLEHLLKNKIITEDVARAAAEWKGRNANDRRNLTELLKEEFGLAQDVLHHQIAQFYAFRVIDINERGGRRLLPADVNRLVRNLPDSLRQLAMRHKVLPYDIAENQPDKVVVVTPNPADREIADVARAFPYKRFEICYMKERDWAEYWRQLVADRRQSGAGSAATETIAEEGEAEFESNLDRDISRAQLLTLVENLFADAVRVGASDIHIVPRGPRKTDVYFRLDGQLSMWYSVEDARAEAVVAAVKGRVLNLDRYERLAAQEGAAQKTFEGQIARFRVSVLPIVSRDLGGRFESVVIRILKDADNHEGLDGIGFDPYSLKAFSGAINARDGLVLMVGPQGSGKTATLIAALRSIMTPALNVVTVEDPVECFIEGARQLKLNYKLEFNDALKAILHHDPDIVLLGEIRDRAAADTALRLAASGRRVFSTAFAAGAVEAVVRLIAMGIEPYLLAHGLKIVVAQRLVRTLCERCKEPLPRVDDGLLARMEFVQEEAESTRFFRAVGCINCIGGFKGRRALHETLLLNDEMREIILKSKDVLDTQALRDAAFRNGMQSLRRAGVELLKRGLSTIEEVASATS